MLALMVRRPRTRNVFVDAHEALARMIGVFRIRYAAFVDLHLDALLTELRAESDEFDRLWQAFTVDTLVAHICVLRHERWGDVRMQFMAFTPVDRPDHTVVTLRERGPTEIGAKSSLRVGTFGARGDLEPQEMGRSVCVHHRREEEDMQERTDIEASSEADLISARRIDLGRFLRERRSRVTPAETAVRFARHRRVAGLRRDEVATLADIGVSWYTLLEQGRVENVSARTLAAVARALRLSAAEREHLFALAAGSFEELNINRTPPSPEIQAFIERASFGMAFIVSPRFDVVAFNDQADRFFRFRAHGPTPNLLRIMLGEPALRDQFIDPDWPTVLAQMIGHFRLWSGRVGGAPFQALVEELRRYPEFTAVWETMSIATPPSERSKLRLGDGAPFDINITAFTSFACPTYTIIFKTPVAADLLATPPAAPDSGRSGIAHRVPAGRTRRVDLGAFLRQRRERMRPAEVGLIPIGRRHAKGLRRDEVAKRAGIGLSWYTMLEQGRVENVTQRTLRSVADALNLTHRERLYVERLSIASFAEFTGFDARPSADLLRFIQEFPDGHAHFHNAHFDMLAWNEQADEFYGFGALGRPNLLDVMARNPRMRTQFVAPNWKETLRRMLAHYRFTHALFESGDSESVVASLAREFADFREVQRGDLGVVNPATEPGMLSYPQRGRRDVDVLLLTPTGLPTHTLVLKIDVATAD